MQKELKKSVFLYLPESTCTSKQAVSHWNVSLTLHFHTFHYSFYQKDRNL